jgi:glutaredoxin
MKQQCHITFVYLSLIMLVGGLVLFLVRGDFLQAASWIIFVPFFLWLYVRYFPLISRYVGYGSVEDQPAVQTTKVAANVTLYTGLGCPFCPLVKKRLKDLQARMGFDLREVDVTLKPDVLISRGIRALPVVEVAEKRLVGNATSEQLAKLIAENSAPNQSP